MFNNREQAGKLLAQKLENYNNNKDVVIVAIPRGGVPVGFEIAKKLRVPLEIVLSKKIGHPQNKEYAIGAVTLNTRILSNDILGVSKDYIKTETERIREILLERSHWYYGSKIPLSLKNKIVILVDDGVATGNTLISSLQLIKEQQPSEITVALPVASKSALRKINSLSFVQQTICLLVPDYFNAVVQFYQEFNQVNDNVVLELLKEANNKFTGIIN